VKIALVVAALLVAWAGAVRAQPAPPSCQTFSRSSAGAPQIVREWLARSADDHVIMCTPAGQSDAGDAAPTYTGENALVKRGTLCSYSSHGLSRVGSGAASRLERYERGDAVGMTAAAGDCPAPHAADSAQRYTMTYDVSPAAFESIMTFWAAVAASVPALERASSCCEARGGADATAPDSAVAAETRRRLRAAIAAGRMRTAAVTRIVRAPGRGIHHRYALFVADPDSRPGAASVYVIYLSKWPLGPYRISAITDVAS
jgi:hypothetical protein